MRLFRYLEYIYEFQKVVSDPSRSGRTKNIDLIWDLPDNSKTLSASVLLKDKLKKEEFDDIVSQLSDTKNVKNSTITKNNFTFNKNTKLSISVNNIAFLQEKLKEDGELRCEYCNHGPLKIYNFGTKFNKRNGATVDHKVPISKGGLIFNWSNLCVCCNKCNSQKDNMDYDDWISQLHI